MLVIGTYAGEGVDLGVWLTVFAVPPFADDAAVGSHYHRPYLRIGRHAPGAVGGELKRPAHIFLIILRLNIFLCFHFILQSLPNKLKSYAERGLHGFREEHEANLMGVICVAAQF